MLFNLCPSRPRRHPRDPRLFPTAQLALLAFVRLSEPIALTSIFPYAWKLVLRFAIGDKTNASFYAGLLISAFALAEALTGMYWGAVSDRWGRKPILLFGCFGTALSLLIVGFSTNFWMALVGRAVGGLLNGNIGIIQTMVAELVTLPEHEPKAYAIMPFVWSIGTIIGPAIGGYFSDPSEAFPSVFPAHGFWERFPFLLPNIICASLLIFAILVGWIFLEETHPDIQPWSTSTDLRYSHAETPILATSGATADAAINLANEQSYGTFNVVDMPHEEKWRLKESGRPASISSESESGEKAFNRRVVMLVVALGIFTYHSMTYDHLLPIFLQDDRAGGDQEVSSLAIQQAFAGGLNLSLQQVGVIMSVNGLIALFVQGLVFPLIASWLGIWKVFLLTAFGHPVAYFMVPWLLFLPLGFLYPGIYICLTVRNFFSILAYPTLLILLKEASPNPSHLGRINGLAASVGAGCRMIASPVAGCLYGLGVQLAFSPLSWWASAIVAVAGGVQVFFMRRQKDKATVHTLARHISRESVRANTRDVVRITVDETIHEESEPSDDGFADEEQALLRR